MVAVSEHGNEAPDRMVYLQVDTLGVGYWGWKVKTASCRQQEGWLLQVAATIHVW